MERLLPIDLERLQFRRTLRGYDPRSVDDWKTRSATEIETLIKELAAMREACERQSGELETLRAQEDTLKNALVLAQKAADETRALAHKEAELILADARGKVRQAHEEVERLRLEATRLAGSLRALADTVDRNQPLEVIEGRAAAE
jgi:cell division initiation protein